jgi:hypothetical protein
MRSLRILGTWTIWVSWTVILLCAVALWFRYPGSQIGQAGGVPSDFSVYYRAWERVAVGENPYMASDPSPYKYSPGVLAMMYLLPHSSAQSAWVFFGSLSIGIFALSMLIGARYRNRNQLLALLIGLGLGWKGILETLDYGQLELLIFGIAVISTALLRRASTFSGLLAGTLPWIKLPWILLLLPMLITVVTRKTAGKLPRFFSGYFAACFLWGAALPALTFGPERALGLSQGWVGILKTQPRSLYFSDINQSLWISIQRWVGSELSAQNGYLTLGCGAILVGCILARLARRTAERGQSSQFAALASISPWLIMTQLLNPLSWRWGSVFLIGIPFAALEAEGRETSRRRPWRIFLWSVVLLLILLQQNPIVKALGYSHWADLHGLGLITVLWIALLLLAI